jgi:hypothetical protein
MAQKIITDPLSQILRHRYVKRPAVLPYCVQHADGH